jgi:hypothetical protein
LKRHQEKEPSLSKTAEKMDETDPASDLSKEVCMHKEQSQNTKARVSGALFLFGLIFPTVNYVFVLSKLKIPEDLGQTLGRLAVDPFWVRVSIANELVLAIAAAVTGAVLFSLLHPIHKTAAQIALCARLVESTLIAAIGLMGFAALSIREMKGPAFGFTAIQLQLPLFLFLKMHTTLIGAFPMAFIGIGLSIFCLLFHKSKYVPAWIALLGVASYLLIFLFAFITILFPEPPPFLEALFWGPSVIFELIIGLLLLIKGVRVPA